jgi:hypothetical protein
VRRWQLPSWIYNFVVHVVSYKFEILTSENRSTGSIFFCLWNELV